jgi:hypothetical protein
MVVQTKELEVPPIADSHRMPYRKAVKLVDSCFTQHFIDGSGNKINILDWQKLEDKINAEPPTLIFDKKGHDEIQSEDMTVSVLLSRIIETLSSLLIGGITEAVKKEIEIKIKNVITGLKPESVNDPWGSFYTEHSNKNISYSFAVSAGADDTSDPKQSFGFIITLNIRSSFTEIKRWWGLEDDTESHFSCIVDHMRLNIDDKY